MATIIWEGNRRELGAVHQSSPVPENAVMLRGADGVLVNAVPFGILPMLICMAAVVMKAYLNREPPVSPVYLISESR